MTHFSDADGAARHRAPARSVRARHARPAGRAHARQQRRHAAPRRRSHARRLGAARHPAVRQRARLSRARRGALAAAARHDAGDAADRRAGRCRPATPSATAPASRPTAPLRIGVAAVRLCRRLSAPLQHRHAGAGERRAHAHGRARQHGHDHGRPHAGARGRLRQRGHAVGPRRQRRRCCPSTRWRAPAAPSATS